MTAVAELLLDEARDAVNTEFTGFLPSQSKKRAAIRVWKCIGQGMKCFYCNQHMTFASAPDGKAPSADTATFEHLIDEFSSVDGKDNSLEKVVMACHSCNAARNKHRTHEVYSFYESLFPNKKLFKAFRAAAQPTDFVKMFGVVPDTWKPVTSS